MLNLGNPNLRSGIFYKDKSKRNGYTMLLFGHAGITLGTSLLLAGVFENSLLLKIKGNEVTVTGQNNPQDAPIGKTPWLNQLGSWIDIRFLLIGSLLPDIIDKPLGHVFFRQIFSNGRIFCHTFLFLIVVAIVGLYLYRHYGKTWMLALSFGTLAHLVLDQMWQTPRTFFWPFLGLTFDKVDISNWTIDILHALFNKPRVYIPELVGVAILIWFTWIVFRRKKVLAFIKYGRV